MKIEQLRRVATAEDDAPHSGPNHRSTVALVNEERTHLRVRKTGRSAWLKNEDFYHATIPLAVSCFVVVFFLVLAKIRDRDLSWASSDRKCSSTNIERSPLPLVPRFFASDHVCVFRSRDIYPTDPCPCNTSLGRVLRGFYKAASEAQSGPARMRAVC